MVPPPCCFPDSEDTDSPDEYELAPTTVSANAQGAQESLTPAAIQGNQEASICALDIPEILSAVGESFYLTYGGKKYLDTNRDKIKSLLSFIPVSKL
ncbi:hypothetical protein BGX33_000689 [Mortierella sp. NVP41]|nr:hypothetical protein BGX33_000689 [Mortierella sp. NVP41]